MKMGIKVYLHRLKKAAEWHLGSKCTRSRIENLRSKIKELGDSTNYHGVKFTFFNE